METAVNIGYACSLLHDTMRQFRVSGSLPEVDKLEAAGKIKESHVLGAQKVEEQVYSVGGGPMAAGLGWAGLPALFRAPGLLPGARLLLVPPPCLHAPRRSAPALPLAPPTHCTHRTPPTSAHLHPHLHPPAQVDELMASAKDSDTQYALIIDGKALAACLTKRLAPVFLRVGLRCAAVVCCRVSPLQKAQVTQLVGGPGAWAGSARVPCRPALPGQGCWLAALLAEGHTWRLAQPLAGSLLCRAPGAACLPARRCATTATPPWPSATAPTTWA
jgi:magnesium-transporting ATPase (P-type)